MSWLNLFIGFLTLILVVDCLFLILLILIQLPKKEAGAGVAFGGAATDALFGAGSGNALTKMTKYSAGIFMALALTLSILNSKHAQQRTGKLEEILRQKANAPTGIINPPSATNISAQRVMSPTQSVQSAVVAAVTNAPSSAATNQNVAPTNAVASAAATNGPKSAATNTANTSAPAATKK